MKYCEDDIKKARKKIDDIETASNMIELCVDCVKLDDDEKVLAYNALEITKNIVRYSKKLDDDKLNKLLRMKMIIEEGCE